MENSCCRVFNRGMIYTQVLTTIIIGICFTVYAGINLTNEEFTTNQYCQLNAMKKTGPDVVDKNISNWCQSEMVLDYTPDQLRPYLQATLIIKVIVCPCLALTSLVALPGIWQKRGCLIWPWLITNTVWIISLVIMIKILGHYGFDKYALFLLPFAAFATVSLLHVGYFTWNIKRRGTWDVPSTDACDNLQNSSYKLKQDHSQSDLEFEKCEDAEDPWGPTSGAT